MSGTLHKMKWKMRRTRRDLDLKNIRKRQQSYSHETSQMQESVCCAPYFWGGAQLFTTLRIVLVFHRLLVPDVCRGLWVLSGMSQSRQIFRGRTDPQRTCHCVYLIMYFVVVASTTCCVLCQTNSLHLDQNRYRSVPGFMHRRTSIKIHL